MIKSHRGLISTKEEVLELSKNLSLSRIIAFDTEFIRETTFFPVVELIQIANENESWLIDAAAFSKAKSGLEPLLEIFRDEKILKVGHALQGDQECLYTAFKVVATPSVDTAIAASLCGYGDGLGLGNLIKAVLNQSIKKGHARTNWSARPLPAQLMEYAHADVQYLIEAWNKLEKQLQDLNRKELALKLSAKFEDVSIYEENPEIIIRKLLGGTRLDEQAQGVLSELVKWREKRVRELNVPRRWLADDSVLLDLARVKPSDLLHLASFRGLNRGEIKTSGAAIIEAINKGLSSPLNFSLAGDHRTETPTKDEGQVIDLLKCFMGMLADKHKIAIRHLATTSQMLPLIRSNFETKEDLYKSRILSDETVALIGEELLTFLAGRLALFVVKEKKKAKVGVVEIKVEGC